MLTGEQIRERRRLLNKTVREFADFMGVSLNTIYRWEAGSVRMHACRERSALVFLEYDAGMESVKIGDAQIKRILADCCYKRFSKLSRPNQFLVVAMLEKMPIEEEEEGSICETIDD